jgi:hypothetical protein
VKRDRLKEVVLAEFFFDEFDGEAGSENRDVEVPKKERRGADVVFMTVGNEKGFHFVLVFSQVLNLGDDHIHAGHVLFRKHEARINNQDILVILEDHHV